MTTSRLLLWTFRTVTQSESELFTGDMSKDNLSPGPVRSGRDNKAATR